MAQRYSKQREVIFNILKNTTSHPSAEWVFMQAKKILPEISIATVYRNLREMLANGKLILVSSSDNKEHYDADVSKHNHFICHECGNIFDVETCGAVEIVDKGFHVERNNITFFGVCEKCNASVGGKDVKIYL